MNFESQNQTKTIFLSSLRKSFYEESFPKNVLFNPLEQAAKECGTQFARLTSDNLYQFLLFYTNDVCFSEDMCLLYSMFHRFNPFLKAKVLELIEESFSRESSINYTKTALKFEG